MYLSWLLILLEVRWLTYRAGLQIMKERKKTHPLHHDQWKRLRSLWYYSTQSCSSRVKEWFRHYPSLRGQRKAVSYKIRITILWFLASFTSLVVQQECTAEFYLFSCFLLENSIWWHDNLARLLNVWYEVHVNWIMLVCPVGVHAPSCIQVSMGSIDKMQ